MERLQNKRSRSRSRSPPPWRRQPKSPRFDRNQDRGRGSGFSGRGRGGQGSFQNQYQRRNQEQEERQMTDWMSQEDDFVLKQSRKKAKIRVKEGRAKLIDKLVLSVVDHATDALEDDLEDAELDIKDPTLLLEEASSSELQELVKEVEHYLVLEHSEANKTFWKAVKSVCKHRRQLLSTDGPGTGIKAVSSDVDRLLQPKSLEQLQTLESQVHQKLRSDEAIDEEYWEQLLESIVLYKAKAHLKKFHLSINQARLNMFRDQQVLIAKQQTGRMNNPSVQPESIPDIVHQHSSDRYEPMPQLRLRPEDQVLEVVDEEEFERRVSQVRDEISHAGYISGAGQKPQSAARLGSRNLLNAATPTEDASSATNLMYNREAAKGVEEDEEVFAGEEEVSVVAKPSWSNKYRPRKPKHFNRVQMGYEWNKYNQTHYDHDNPPPKVVQGYKFNIFYPDLIDNTKAPTYRIERENGRKKGQSLAPAGEEDTCLIRFIGGPPYEDIAFRIVDREWDYSAKRERGFKSSFEKGILQLHFQFKKIYYRK